MVDAKQRGYAIPGLFDLTGTSALVAGGSSGIGLAMADALSTAGATVAVWGRNPDKLEEVRHSRGYLVFQVDVSDEEAVIRAIKDTVSGLGRLDTVVISAGGGEYLGPLIDSSTEAFDVALTTNLRGAYWTLREAAREMVRETYDRETGGSIILISSLAATEASAGNQAYGAAKAGVLAMSRSSAVELARYGIRVNAVLPGWIATDLTAAIQGSEPVETKVIPRVPLRRWGRPDEFGGIAVYLASRASTYHSGDALVIDGGYSIF